MDKPAIPRRIADVPLAVLTTGLAKKFGNNVALSNVDLTVPSNSFYLFVGPNGSGKSTTVRILLDIMRADQGIAEVLGSDTRKGGAARAHIGWVPDNHNTHYGWMTAGEMIDFHSHFYSGWDHAYARQLEKSLGVVRSRKVQNSSRGEVRRMQLVLALAHRPRLLLLDEPTDGLDPAAREMLLGTVAEHLSDSETTVFLATHLVHEVERLADHIGVIREGKIVAQLTREDLDRNLRSYSMHVNDSWQETGVAQALNVLRRNGRHGERRWIVWGSERSVAARLTASGASISEVGPVSLEDAAVAFTAHEET